MFKKVIKKIESNPRKLFLIDGLGAILSAFLVGVVLVKFESFFGIPASTLYILASIPIFFVVYDFYAYQKDNYNLVPYLKGIAVMNLIYCCLSIGFGLYHREVINFWGWYYILSEVFILIILINLEFRVVKKLNQKK